MVKQANQTFFIGCGNMGTAMLKGWQTAGYDLKLFSALVNRPQSVTRLQPLLADRVTATSDIPNDLSGLTSGIVILGFKPQQLVLIGPLLADLPTDVLVLSMLASTSIKKLQNYLPNHQIVRCMPALSVQYGISRTPLCSNDISAQHKAIIQSMFEALGGCFWADESQMPLLSVINGSIPAIYLEYSLQMAKVASDLGLDSAAAQQFTAQGLISAARLIQEKPATASVDSIIQAVSSKGGITLAYNNATRDKLYQLAEQGLQASISRGEEIEKEL